MNPALSSSSSSLVVVLDLSLASKARITRTRTTTRTSQVLGGKDHQPPELTAASPLSSEERGWGEVELLFRTSDFALLSDFGLRT